MSLLRVFIGTADFFGLDEMNSEGSSNVNSTTAFNFQLRINQLLNRFYRKSLSKKEPDEPLLLLHIGDMQFGDKHFSTISKVASERILANFIVNNLKLNVDFVAITGDIAYSGLQSEYILAEEWLRSLCKYLFPEEFHNYGERILLVPGNHDVNISFSISDHLKYNRRIKTEGPRESNISLVNEKEKN